MEVRVAGEMEEAGGRNECRDPSSDCIPHSCEESLDRVNYRVRWKLVTRYVPDRYRTCIYCHNLSEASHYRTQHADWHIFTNRALIEFLVVGAVVCM